MKPCRVFTIVAVLVLGLGGGTPTQAQSDDADSAALLHQAITSSCMYGFKQYPRAASLPPEVGGKICHCVDKWFQDNNLNTLEDTQANKPVMNKVVTYCVAVLVAEQQQAH